MLTEFGGRIINTAQILWVEEVARHERGFERCKIHFVGGESLIVPVPASSFSRLCGSLIPAPPGYSVVKATPPGLNEQDRSVVYEIEPVIAFRFNGEDELPLDAITVRGTGTDYDYALVRPDGTCLDCDRDYESVDAYKASFSAAYASDTPATSEQAE